MSDPSLELQSAIVAALKANPAVAALVAGRVYDEVPSGATKPYVTLGQPQVLPDRADCIDGADVNFPIHGWAAGPQSVIVKRLGKAIAAALDNASLSLSGHRAVLVEVDQIEYLDDPDALTKHAVVSIRVLTEPTD